jgi:hypothetical protein
VTGQNQLRLCRGEQGLCPFEQVAEEVSSLPISDRNFGGSLQSWPIFELIGVPQPLPELSAPVEPNP